MKPGRTNRGDAVNASVAKTPAANRRRGLTWRRLVLDPNYNGVIRNYEARAALRPNVEAFEGLVKANFSQVVRP